MSATLDLPVGLLTFDVPLNPIPLGRPRFVKGRTIMPARSLDWRKTFRTFLALELPRQPLEGPLALQVCFWRQCRSIMQRGDLTNLVKAVEDACNPDKKLGWPGLWRDDRQITYLEAAIIASGPKVEGRVFVSVGPFDDARTLTKLARAVTP